MPSTTFSNIGLSAQWSAGEGGWKPGMDANFRALDVLVMPVVLSIGANSPPSTSEGYTYIVGTSPSGVWSGQGNRIARYSGAISGWEFFTAKNGWEVYDQTTNKKYRWSSNTGSWLPIEGLIELNNQSATSYTFVAADLGKTVRSTSATATTYTIPTNASVPFPVGAVLTLRQAGTGQITLSGAGGVTLNTPTGFFPKTGRQYATVSAHQVSANVWDILGDLSTT